MIYEKIKIEIKENMKVSNFIDLIILIWYNICIDYVEFW